MAKQRPDRGKRSPVRVEVQRQNLNDDYLITPNDLLRGRGIYAVLSEFARLLLGAGLSCASKWETTLDEIESWLPSLGRDRHEAVRRELREHGFLSATPHRIPPGHPDSGQYVWSFKFFMTPLPADQRDELQPKKPPRKNPGPTMPGISGHGDDVGKTAGGTGPGSSGLRHPGLRHPGQGGSGLSYKEEKNHPEEEPPPPVVPPPPDESQGHSEEEEDRAEAELNTASAVLDAAQQRGRAPATKLVRSRGQLRSLLGQTIVALRAGWTPEDLVDALGGDLTQVRNPTVFGVLRSRLVELGDPPRRTPAPPPVPRQPCHDGCQNGWVDVGPKSGNRGLVACPGCRPKHFQAQLAQARADGYEIDTFEGLAAMADGRAELVGADTSRSA